ncbi:transposase [Sedimentibacter sp. zth1]|uniref:transposase n=1 Tax=Sedimentibacter sp. zth1 TaxID=2816908 RepID=UPI001A92A82A|nr:transposase [Sedimentibacter sp. zth1]QSX07042.1 transposase [Sedimentibacter sp. zth1]
MLISLYVICGSTYTELAKSLFPNAKIVIDKYHFIRQITWAIENVRKRLQKQMPVDLRRYVYLMVYITLIDLKIVYYIVLTNFNF